MQIYAAYGSNMNLAQMKKRCPKAQVIGKGELLGYKLTFRGKGTGYANIEVSDCGSVPIVLWSITKECERALDRYEGYPRLYTKELVKIMTTDGEQTAMLYIMTKRYAATTVMPSENYFEIIRQGYQDHEINTESLMEALKFTRDEIVNQ
ncbi:gamma-glutamylcyclotransferase family protein [Pelosinus sp. sgz500959]|uniref:gamma-glutamylcyclotransferase family protein n=1 Tax=Pelosinus sp. sgz500959 TaxID=3242472 RepID=UPI00366FEEB3